MIAPICVWGRRDRGFRLGVSVGKVLLFGLVARVNPPASKQVDPHRPVPAFWGLPFLQPKRGFFGDGLELDLDRRLPGRWPSS